MSTRVVTSGAVKNLVAIGFGEERRKGDALSVRLVIIVLMEVEGG